MAIFLPPIQHALPLSCLAAYESVLCYPVIVFLIAVVQTHSFKSPIPTGIKLHQGCFAQVGGIRVRLDDRR